MINFAEIFVSCVSGSIMLLFLLFFRIKNSGLKPIGENLYKSLLLVALLAINFEMLSFVIDGRDIFCGRQLQYLLNSLTIELTILIGIQWCLFVDFRIHISWARIKKKGRRMSLIALLFLVLLIANVFCDSLMFHVSSDNVYSRGKLTTLVYVSLLVFFLESAYTVYRSKKNGITVEFFPVYYFIVPCIIGSVVQAFFYGLATGWLSVAIALVFVNLQLQNFNTFVDELSGLFNRKYMNYYLEKLKKANANDIYGIMLDVNKFKRINDEYGHAKGDCAIHDVGEILTMAVSENAIPMRMAGDEFVVIVKGFIGDVEETQASITAKLEEKNRTTSEPYRLSMSMGVAKFDGNNIEKFLMDMDKQMYEEKRKYHEQL